MKIDKLKIRLTFTEPLLGTASGNKEIHEEFIASKCPTVAGLKEEVAAVPEEEFAKAKTVFHRDGDKLQLWDYQVKGFFKEALGVLGVLGQHEVKGFKKTADNILFITPRRLHLQRDGQPMIKPDSDNTQPLRVDTAQGPRVALATSEQVDGGAYVEFTIALLQREGGSSKKELFKMSDLEEALDYGALKGLGQWRNAGYGRFTWEKIS